MRESISRLSGAHFFGKRVHPTELGEEGTFVMSRAFTGGTPHFGHRIDLIDAEGRKRSVCIVREDNCLRWLTFEGRETHRTGFWRRDVYDLLLESYPFIADTAEEAIEDFMHRYGVIAPSVVTNWGVRRMLMRSETTVERWQAVFIENYGEICSGCDVCEEAPSWYIHRVFD
jgi:hypothetical protein